MRKLTQFVRDFVKGEDGPTAVEYAVLLALIIVVCLLSISALGTNANTPILSRNSLTIRAASRGPTPSERASIALSCATIARVSSSSNRAGTSRSRSRAPATARLRSPAWRC